VARSIPGVLAPVLAATRSYRQERRVVNHVEQIIKPATGLPGSPSVQVGLHSSYRQKGPSIAGPIPGADIHLAVLVVEQNDRSRGIGCVSRSENVVTVAVEGMTVTALTSPSQTCVHGRNQLALPCNRGGLVLLIGCSRLVVGTPDSFPRRRN
jgi:hypothetical protein